jgi:hypothetical protein
VKRKFFPKEILCELDIQQKGKAVAAHIIVGDFHVPTQTTTTTKKEYHEFGVQTWISFFF